MDGISKVLVATYSNHCRFHDRVLYFMIKLLPRLQSYTCSVFACPVRTRSFLEQQTSRRSGLLFVSIGQSVLQNAAKVSKHSVAPLRVGSL